MRIVPLLFNDALRFDRGKCLDEAKWVDFSIDPETHYQRVQAMLRRPINGSCLDVRLALVSSVFGGGAAFCAIP